MRKPGAIHGFCLLLFLAAHCSRAADGRTLNRAYDAQAQGRISEAIVLFEDYLRENPTNLQATLDLTGLLSLGNRHEEAAQRLGYLSRAYPEQETVRFKLAAEKVLLLQFDESKALFEELLNSTNPDMAEAAEAALVQLEQDRLRHTRRQAEQEVYRLTQEFKSSEALEAISALESEGRLSYPIALQRLYLLYSLGRFAEAAQKAESLSLQYPRKPDLEFLRAELYMQLGQVTEAKRVWENIEANYPGSYAADEAARRKSFTVAPESNTSAEKEVYRLAEAGNFREVIRIVDQIEIEQEGLPRHLEMQRLYALYNLNYFELAKAGAEEMAGRYPGDIDLALFRAELLVKLGMPEEAEVIWRDIEKQVPETAVALEARRRREALHPPNTTGAKEQQIYQLASENKQSEVVEAVGLLEKEEGTVSLAMEMQRLYAWLALREYERALQRANTLLTTYQDDPGLAFLTADLLAKLGRFRDAELIWRRMVENHPNTPLGQEAQARLETIASVEDLSPEEIRILELAGDQKYDEVVAAVDDLESKQGGVTPKLRLQRIYALVAIKDIDRALVESEKSSRLPGMPTEISFLRAELLGQRRRWEESSSILHDLKKSFPEGSIRQEIDRRLQAIPLVANLDRWHWGEAYSSGDYYGRYEALVGSGFVRYGTFVPKARWLQPHAEFKYVVDTESDTTGRRPTIISDNFVGHYAGLRTQLFKREYLFLYAQAGVNRALLDQRDDGEYAFDYQVGIYGYKSWGPGVVLRQPIEGDFQFRKSDRDASMVQTNGLFWRGDWFADTSANFSYYHRYASWIGYGQVREGLRLFQISPKLGFDSYLVQNLAWDIRGNYFDNFFEVGPGVRWLWTPCEKAQVVLRAEWHYGAYLGRHPEQRGGAQSSYDEIVTGLSVGMRW